MPRLVEPCSKTAYISADLVFPTIHQKLISLTISCHPNITSHRFERWPKNDKDDEMMTRSVLYWNRYRNRYMQTYRTLIRLLHEIIGVWPDPLVEERSPLFTLNSKFRQSRFGWKREYAQVAYAVHTAIKSKERSPNRRRSLLESKSFPSWNEIRTSNLNTYF